MRFKDKVAIVTGGGSGIGKATAKLLASEGAKLVVTDYAKESGERTAVEIRDGGGQATFMETDVQVASQVEAMIQHAVDAYGGLHVLHNNAGVFPPATPIDELAEDQWDRVIDTNLKGVWLGCKYAAPVMRDQGGGAIVNTASMAGIRGRANQSAYCASKGGVVMLTKALAIELASWKIRVNCICPGGTNTPLVRPAGLSEDAWAQQIGPAMAGQPIPRLASPEEMADAAAYLASDQSSYVNGFALWVDGGGWAGTTDGMRPHPQDT